MNSRERIIAAIKNQPTDKPCCNFRAEPTTLEKIRRHTGCQDIDLLLDEMDVDIRHIDATPPPEKRVGDLFQNYWGERYVYRPTPFGPERDDTVGALATAQSMEELEAFDWVRNDDFDYSRIPALCDKYAGRAIMYGTGDVFQRPGLVRGMENFLVDMYENPEFCHYLCNRFTDFYVEDYRRAFEASRGRIDIFLIYSDLGSQRSTLFSTQMAKDFVMPYLRRIAEAVHEMGAHLFYHSCGMISPFIPLFIEAGVDILDPIQPVDESMQPESLAKAYAGKLCFHGGIDVQHVLTQGTPDEVAAEARRYIEAFRGKCGYICAPSHFLQPDTPVENILALYRALRA